jgi:hypothetical protein
VALSRPTGRQSPVHVDKQFTAAQVRAEAQCWYDRQLEVSARCLGSDWPVYREWIEDYLKTELRERLIAMGWRAIDGR